jgi:predicted nucleotidyltransferase
MDTRFRSLIDQILKESLDLFRDNLRALVLFGSVARNSARTDSDIDLLFVFKELPINRRERTDLIVELEKNLTEDFQTICNQGITTCISAIIKSSDEAGYLSPLYLDLLEDGRVLLDRDSQIDNILQRLRKALKKTGGRRIWKGQRWYWDLKPDLAFGEVVEIE